MDIKSLTLCIITIFRFCDSVDIDYYADKDPIDNDKETDRVQNNQSMEDETKVDVAAENLTFYARTAHGNSTNSTTKSIRKNNYDNIYDETKTPSARFTNIFDDYEYEYDDERENFLLDIFHPTTPNEMPPTTPFNENYVDSVEYQTANTSNVKNADIYNLEPAMAKLVINKTSRKVSKRVWYVQEEYPCWRLPLLFGKRKNRVPWAKIFTLSGPELHEVRLNREDNDEKMTRRNFMYDESNQWCKRGPCYGDHILCIFPTNRISRICGNGYKVNMLSANERWEVTNSINKIRNRVALGLVSDHLPSATNMHLIRYDKDLAMMSNQWLRQCLPGPAPCSALHDDLVTQLECLKSMRMCCLDTGDKHCVAPEECFVSPLVGCIHTWFLSGFDEIRNRNIKCGYITQSTFNTAQILWAQTTKVGCAYAEKKNGDIRVVCSFSPGARFYLTTNYYCGVMPHYDITKNYKDLPDDIVSLSFMASLGYNLNVRNLTYENWKKDVPLTFAFSTMPWGVEAIHETLEEDYLRIFEEVFENGTIGAVARLVVKYSFFEDSDAKCDTKVSIYDIGPAGVACEATSRLFSGLCFEYRGPDPFYRVSAILAPIALFSLILYDLFNGVLRQTNF